MTKELGLKEHPLEGFALLGSLLQLNDINEAKSLLNNELDDVLKSAIFFQNNHFIARDLKELNSCPYTEAKLRQLKDIVRNHLQFKLNSENKRVQKEAEKSFQKQHQKSNLGTVAEIASQYNLSKKKVRELKREGKLDDYIKNL